MKENMKKGNEDSQTIIDESLEKSIATQKARASKTTTTTTASTGGKKTVKK